MVIRTLNFETDIFLSLKKNSADDDNIFKFLVFENSALYERG